MAQFVRPTSDVAAGSWTATPLWSKVDANDGSTITSANNTTPDNADFACNSISDPAVSTGHVLRAEWNKSASAGHSINAVLELWQGVPGTGTLVATLSVTGISETPQTSTYTLSAGEADAITNYSTLHLRLSRQGDTGGAPGGRRSLVADFVELETPDAGATVVEGEASITGTAAGTRNGAAIAKAEGSAAGLATTSFVAGIDRVGWWKADALALSDNDPVETWTDSSDAGNDVAQATADARPLFKTNILNGLPAVLFDGIDDYLEFILPATITSDYTIFVVQQPLTVNTFEAAFASSGATQAKTFQLEFNNSNWSHRSRNNADDGNTLLIISPATIGETALITARGNSSGQQTWKDGVAGDTAADPTSGEFVRYRIGANRALSAPYSGYIAEVILFQHSLSDTARAAIEADLTAKWFGDGSEATIAGAAAVSAIGASVAEAAATSTGLATTTAIGSAVVEATATEAGSASVTAAGAALNAAEATIAGSAISTAIGVGAAASVATAVGSATVTGLGAALANSEIVITGIATVSGVGQAYAAEFSVAFSDAFNVVELATDEAVTEIVGTATVSPLSGATAGVPAVIAGVTTVTPFSAATIAAVATVVGSATATGIGGAAASSAGAVIGAATVSAAGAATAESDAVVIGSATVSGVSGVVASAMVTVAGVATVTAESGNEAVVDIAGAAVVTAAAGATASSIATIAAGPVVTGIGRATAIGTFTVAGTAVATFESTLDGSLFAVEGVTTPVFAAGSVAASALASAGTASVTALMEAVANSEIVVAGSATVAPKGGTSNTCEYSFIAAAEVAGVSGATSGVAFAVSAAASVFGRGEAVGGGPSPSGGLVRRRRR